MFGELCLVASERTLRPGHVRWKREKINNVKQSRPASASILEIICPVAY